jgi:hypothetical protein
MNFKFKELEITPEDALSIAREHINNWIIETNIDPSEFSIKFMEIYGSQRYGIPSVKSDIDVKIYYTGTMSEEDAFNGINYNGGAIVYGLKFREIKIDINPVNVTSP